VSSLRFVYLHGFASGPSSNKARYFQRRFEESGVPLAVPALDDGDFERLTVSGQLAVIDRAAAGRDSILIGSSLGGYLAALYAARHPEVQRVVLLAPAFQFARRFRERFSPQDLEHWKRHGSIPIFHFSHGAERPLGYQILEDAVQYEDEPEFPQPALILHGRSDPVVPAAISEAYAQRHRNVTLRLYDSGHELTGVLDPMWDEVKAFLPFPSK
jgi:pimeloyl-ACP methyl ester carboxylesterase